MPHGQPPSYPSYQGFEQQPQGHYQTHQFRPAPPEYYCGDHRQMAPPSGMPYRSDPRYPGPHFQTHQFGQGPSEWHSQAAPPNRMMQHGFDQHPGPQAHYPSLASQTPHASDYEYDGHRSSRRRQLRRHRRRGNAPPPSQPERFCSNCEQPGHTAVNCRAARQEEEDEKPHIEEDRQEQQQPRIKEEQPESRPFIKVERTD
ncbi:hypothetical protein ACHAPU_008912 [Fusarium lateritium]